MNVNYDLQREKTFKSLWFLIFMIYFCYGILPVNIDNLLINLPGTTKLGIGICAASYLFTTSISLIFFGYYEDKIIDKKIRKNVFVFTNSLWVVGYGLISISINFHFYLFFTIIAAIGIGAFIPLGFSIIGDFYPPKDRGKKYGSITFSLTIGTGLGIIIGGLLGTYAEPNGWRFAYAIGFILGLIAIVNYFLKGIDPKRGMAEPEFKDFKEDFQYDYKIDIKSLGPILKKKSVASILFYTLFAGIAISTIGAWGIFYLTSKFSGFYTEMAAASLYLLTGVGILPGSIIGGRLGDTLHNSGKIRGRIYLTSIGLISGIVCLIIFYLVPITATSHLELVINWFFFLIIGFMGYFLVSLSIGNVFAIYSEVVVPEARSTVNSLNRIMSNIGGIIGNLAFSLLIERDISLLPYAMTFILLCWMIGTSLWIITYIYFPKEYKDYRKLMNERKNEIKQNNH
ncbi:MAG: MFS transporter [Promethearchaeota archaeon]